jgi:hypothetical protein
VDRGTGCVRTRCPSTASFDVIEVGQVSLFGWDADGELYVLALTRASSITSTRRRAPLTSAEQRFYVIWPM